MKNYSIVCDSAERFEIFHALRLCGIDFESSYYSEGKSYIVVSCTDQQAIEYESVISSGEDDLSMISFYVDFCDAIVSLDRRGWMIEEPSHIERFDSYDDMVAAIRYCVEQWEIDGIIEITRKPDTVIYRSLID